MCQLKGVNYMFGRKAKNIYLGEVVLRPGKHYILVDYQNSKKFIFSSDHEKTSFVSCPPGYHPVSHSGYGQVGGCSLLYENHVPVKVKAYQNQKTQQKVFPEFGVPVR